MKKKSAIFVLSDDGITSHYAGVGTLTNSYLDTIRNSDSIKQKCDLFLITTYKAPEFFGYKEEVEESSRKLASEFNGKLITIEDGLNGLEGYGRVDNWDKASQNAAKEIIKLHDNYEKVYIIAMDTPFMKIGDFLHDIDNLVLNLSPQSLESIHKTQIEGRYEWEKEALSDIVGHENYWVSYSSYYLRDELISNYSVPEKQLLKSMSGINLKSDRYKLYQQEEIKEELDKYGLPTDRDIVFTVGRLEKYKGFDQAIFFFNQIDKKTNPYLVILGLSYFENDPVVKQINELVKTHSIDSTFYTEGDMHLPILLWQWHRTKYSLNLSMAEPFGMAPIEARYLSGMSGGPLVVTSNNGGLAEQCENQINGLKVEYNNIEEYIETISFVNSLSGEEYNLFRAKCAKHVTECYDASKNILEHFSLLGIV